ncbi:hypothetical protein HMPREF1092_02944 [Clostridium thermobutyricum]|uniref:SEFIR domain-containing protein n=2 Tax=Clostridium thermobutyricum TaxID=29372 RepID=N9XV52_9CLOT|nr:hypothetical protein HMPREF1092_02944 [Clostridium thermobutyricum]
MDLFETQQGTVNLNQMMIKNIKDSDYVVIVLTEEYAKKSDGFQGGVGFETMLTIPDIKNNLNKLIFIMRHKGDYTKVFPYHIRDVYAIDFSNESNFDEKLEELIYKIYNVPLYNMEPIGEIPNLVPKKSIVDNTRSNNDITMELDDLLIPKVKEVTDIEKNEFMKRCYNDILGIFKSLLSKSEEINQNFSYELEEITARKAIIKTFVNGTLVTGLKIWLGSSMGMRENSICISSGNWINENDDGSMNEIINCEIDENKELKLKMLMNFLVSNKLMDAKEMAKEIWIKYIKNIM